MEFISKWRKNKKEDLNILKVSPNKRRKSYIEQSKGLDDKQRIDKLKKSSHDLAGALKYPQSSGFLFDGIESYFKKLKKEPIIKRFIDDKNSDTGKILKLFIDKLEMLINDINRFEEEIKEKKFSTSLSVQFKSLEVKIRDLSDIYFEMGKLKSHFKATMLNKEVLKTFDDAIIKIKKIFTVELKKLRVNVNYDQYSVGGYQIGEEENSNQNLNKRAVILAKQLKYEPKNKDSIYSQIDLYRMCIQPKEPLKSISKKILNEYCKILNDVLNILGDSYYSKKELKSKIVKLKDWMYRFKNKSLPIIKKAYITPMILKRPAYTIFISSMDEIIGDIESEYLSKGEETSREDEIYMEENVDSKIQ